MRVQKAPKLSNHEVLMNEYLVPLLDEVSEFLTATGLERPALWNIIFEEGFDVKEGRSVWYCHIYSEVDADLYNYLC
jgi:hypothetical protein